MAEPKCGLARSKICFKRLLGLRTRCGLIDTWLQRQMLSIDTPNPHHMPFNWQDQMWPSRFNGRRNPNHLHDAAASVAMLCSCCCCCICCYTQLHTPPYSIYHDLLLQNHKYCTCCAKQNFHGTFLRVIKTIRYIGEWDPAWLSQDILSISMIFSK